MDTSGQSGGGSGFPHLGLPPLSGGGSANNSNSLGGFGLAVGQGHRNGQGGSGFREDVGDSERRLEGSGNAGGADLGTLHLPNSSLRINPAVFGDLLSQISEYPNSGSRHRRVLSDTPVQAGTGENVVMDDVEMGADISEAGEEGLLSDMVEGGRGGGASGASLSGSALFPGSSGMQGVGDKLGSRGTGIGLSGAGGAGPNLGLGGGGASSGGAGAAGAGGGGGGTGGSSGGYHSRSFSVDDAFLFKAGPLKETLSPIMSPIAPPRRSRRGSEGGLSIKDEVDELEDSEAIQRVMATKKPSVDEHIDAKKAKRILANRLSAARSKERKTRYIMELEEKVALYEKQATALKATLSILQRETTSLAEANDGMSKKLQLLEQLYQQSEAENKHLHDQLEVLRKTAGLGTMGLLGQGMGGGAGGLSGQPSSAGGSSGMSGAAAAAAAAAASVPGLSNTPAQAGNQLENQVTQLLKLLQSQPQAVQALLGLQQQQQQQQQPNLELKSQAQQQHQLLALQTALQQQQQQQQQSAQPPQQQQQQPSQHNFLFRTQYSSSSG